MPVGGDYSLVPLLLLLFVKTDLVGLLRFLCNVLWRARILTGLSQN